MNHGYPRLLWVKREGAASIPDSELRYRAGLEDESIEVETIALGKWQHTDIPKGSRDESGDLTLHLSLGPEVVPPEGRVFVVYDD